MKDKTTAALLALFFGWFGIHRFYLRQPGLGVVYIFLLFVFGISFLLGVIDAIVFLAMDQKEFDRRYNEHDYRRSHDRYERRTVQRDYTKDHHRRPQQAAAQRHAQSLPANVQVPERQRVNPYKQSGIRKYKDFELEDAIEDFKKGLEINPRDVALHFNIACAYSLTEQVDLAYAHLDKAVALGFTDLDRIRTHDDLAFVRIQPQFDAFAEAGFRLVQKTEKIQSASQSPEKHGISGTQEQPMDDLLLTQLKRLSELRDKGLITEHEFAAEKNKLMR